VWEILTIFGGEKIQPIELSESKFSFSTTDCPMVQVTKDINSNVKGKYCDLLCTAGSKALMDTLLSPCKGSCTWNKAMIKGVGKCTVVFELVKDR